MPIGPFQSSLSFVAKPNKPDKFCSVHNFSYPHLHLSNSHTSTIPLTSMYFHALGVPLLLCLISYTTYPLGPKPPYKMSPKCTVPYLSLPVSGLASLCGFVKTTPLLSIHATTLASPQLVAFMGNSLMQHLTSSKPMVLAHLESGPTTMYFFLHSKQIPHFLQ